MRPISAAAASLRYSEVNMPTTVVNGARLFWKLEGQAGDPLVLVHGGWGDHHGWDQIMPALARTYRVLSYDRRGHSQSERPVSQGSKREDAADLAALVEHLDLAPAHFLGNSFGASIVLQLASEQPDIFLSLQAHEPPLFGLILESTDPLEREVAQKMELRRRAVIKLLEDDEIEAGARLFMESIAFGPGAWEQLPAEARQTCIFNAPTFLDEGRDPEWLMLDVKRLANFAPPALLTQGDQSEPFFNLVLNAVMRALPRMRRQTVHGAGHVPQVSHPEAYLEVVTSFLRSASTSASGLAS
jgi:pimeloyl-ACP methyl ester carboxylesterase